MKRLFDVDPWKIETNTLYKEDKRLQESLTSIGNAYMGMRGFFEEGYSGDSHTGTYIGGVWYPDKTRVGWWKNGYPEYFGKVVNIVNFIAIDILINQAPLDLAVASVSDYKLSLNMKDGVLSRSFILKTKETRIKFNFERFLSLDSKELAVVHLTLEVLEGQADLTLRPKLDGHVQNEEERFFEEIERDIAPFPYLKIKTKNNPYNVERFIISTLMTTNVTVNEKQLDRKNEIDSSTCVGERFETSLKEGDQLELSKYIAVITSRDVEETRHIEKGKEILEKAKEKGFCTLLTRQRSEWKKRWEQADVIIEGDDEAQQGMRYNIFQLLSTYDGSDSRLNIGPKGFSGEKYGGATYWDTEAFVFPMVLSIAPSKIARQLLQYRYIYLDEAKENARKLGLEGALYPMVTFDGYESHNEWEITFEEIHRNGAIAHAIFNYTTYTDDTSYLYNEGIEILVELSRFWASRVHFTERHDAYMIHGVTGPNEFENNVNNNWHTNVVCRWTLEYTLETLEKLPKEKRETLHLEEKELNKWQDIIERLYFPYDDDLEIYVQHDGFLDKDLHPASSLPAKERPIVKHWSWDKILRSPFIKQADVLQSLYYFRAFFPEEVIKRNYNFYEPMTVHESSLSPAIHSVLASRINNYEDAFKYFKQTARLDLDNYNKDTEDGLHITSMSGGWLAICHGFAGMETTHGELTFQPYLPEAWEAYSFNFHYRGSTIQIKVTKKGTSFASSSGKPIQIIKEGDLYRIEGSDHA